MFRVGALLDTPSCQVWADTGDVGLFVAVLLGQNSTPSRILASDINSDGVTDGLDIQLFVEKVLGG